MTMPRTIRNFNCFIDGYGYAGLASEAKLPKLKIKTEAHLAAGMAGPVGIDMGLEGMTSEITLTEWVPNALKSFGREVRFVFRPATSGEGFESARIIVTLAGLVDGNDFDDLKAGSNAPVKISMDVRTYRLEIDGEAVHDIDLVGGKRVIGSEDQLKSARAAMGI